MAHKSCRREREWISISHNDAQAFRYLLLPCSVIGASFRVFESCVDSTYMTVYNLNSIGCLHVTCHRGAHDQTSGTSAQVGRGHSMQHTAMHSKPGDLRYHHIRYTTVDVICMKQTPAVQVQTSP